MKPTRYREIKEHMRHCMKTGDPLKDFEDVNMLVWELWDEIERLRLALSFAAAPTQEGIPK